MADAGDLYDEFGNYIGPELSESEEVSAALGGGGLGGPTDHGTSFDPPPAHHASVVACGTVMALSELS